MDEINYQRINTKFLNNVIKMEPNFDDKEQVFAQNQEVDFIPCVLKFDDTKLVENIEKIPFSDHNQNCCDQIIDDRPAFAELMKNNSEHENSYIEEDEDELKYFNKDVSDSQMCSIKEEGFEERQDSDDEMTADDYITFYGGQSTSRYHNIHNEGKSILGQKSVKNLAANYKLLPRDEDQEKFFSEVICLTDEESFIVDDEYPTSQRQGFKKIKSHSNSQSTPIYQLQTEDEFIMIVEQKQQEDDDVIFINPTTGKEEPWTPNSKKATSIFSTTSPESHTLTEVEESTNKNVSNQTRIPLAIARNVTPWTPEEDRKLIEGVLTQLSPSWIQISRNYELNRSGDSCRQRWARLKKRLYGSA